MNVARLLKVDATVTSVSLTGTEDEFGDPTEETSTAIYKAWAWQTSRSDETVGTDVQSQKWRIALHRSAEGLVDGGDRITYEGTEYEVDGPPWIARNPRTGRVEYIEATMRRSTT
jgi:hypothetical protein